MSIQSINKDQNTAKYYPVITTLILTLLYIRLMAGVSDGFILIGASQATSLVIMAFSSIVLLSKMSIPKVSSMWLISCSTLVFALTTSASYNGVLFKSSSISVIATVVLYLMMMPVCLIGLRNKTAIYGIYKFAVFYCIISIILVLYQISTGNLHFDETGLREGRAYGPTSHPVSFGIQIVSALVLLEISRLKSGRSISAMHITCIAFGLICLYYSQARSAWLMAVIVFGLYTSIDMSKNLRFIFFVSFFVISTSTLMTSDRFSDLYTLVDFFKYTDFTSGIYDFRFVDNSLSWRISNWYLMLDAVLQRPALGFGPGQVKEISLFDLEAHNLLIEILVQGGLLAGVSLIAIFVSIWKISSNVPEHSSFDIKAKKLLKLYILSLLAVSMIGASLIYQTMTIVIMIVNISIASASLKSKRAACDENS